MTCPEEPRMYRVLVVDGDENVLRLLEIKLARAGFTVETASDGEDGYRRALEVGPDVAIVGDALGPLDGYSLASALAGLPSPPASIFLSRSEGAEDIRHALRAGCDDYVLKPFSPHELIHRVRVVIMRRLAREERGA